MFASLELWEDAQFSLQLPQIELVVTDASIVQVLQSDIDLLHPPQELEKQKHKLKRLVQSPNSFFMDVKCAGCFQM